MTKKSLSDLLREEAKSPSETITETTQISTVPTNRSRMTKAQLDVLITQLNQALQEERELSRRLQNELQAAENYQSQLNEQKQLVEKLYTQLQQKEELAVELAEKNELIASLHAKLQQEPLPLVSTDSPPELEVQETALTRQAKELEPFTAPVVTSKPLTNDDIGWFD